MSNLLPDAPVVPDNGRWKPVQRGFPEGTEVLSELGWVRLEELYSSRFLGDAVPWRGNGRSEPGYAPKKLEWGQWLVNDSFPRLGSVDPSSGEVVFVRPKRFMYFLYDGRLVHLKMKGVDMVTSLFSDWWLHPKYARGWKFVLADDVVRNVHGNAHYGLLNKFNRDMYGWWSPERDLLGESLLPIPGGESMSVLRSDVKCFIDAPILVYPKKHVKRKRVWDLFEYSSVGADGSRVVVDRVRVDVPLFNVDIEPFHNIIVRRGRKDENPRTLWVGGPVVMGDGLDKSELRVSGVLGAGKALGGSYNVLRPDFRVTGSDSIKDKE